MNLLKRCIIFIHLIYGSLQDCVLTRDVLRCNNVSQKELMYEYNSKVTEDDNITVIEVMGGDVSIVGKFHGPLKEKLEKIAMKSCGIEKIEADALANVKNLKELDLSHNKIQDLTFLSDLPQGIEIISLSNNTIDHLDDIFGKFQSLRIIDLSHCVLTTLDFTLFKHNPNLELVNVSNNRIASSVSKEFLKNIKCVDVSHNELTSYDNVPSYCLDFSYTNSSGYQWYNVSEHNKTVYVEKFLFSGNDKLKMSATNLNGDALNIEVKYLNVSQFKSDASALNLTQLKVTKELDLKDSPINALDKSTVDFKPLFYDDGTNATFDLSNCSIRDISGGYFQGYNLGKLNLCHNNFTEIKSGTFQDAYIVEVNLCDSNIEVIDPLAFQHLHCKKLNLTRNKLSEINFNATGLKELDLSWNMLRVVNRSTFTGFPELQLLDLRHNLIDRIDENAMSLENVRTIYLSSNQLTTLPVFRNIPTLSILYLDQNPASFIGTGTFTTLPQLVSLNLAEMQLETIQPGSFYQVGNLKEIDLSNNKIIVIPDKVFVQAPSLQYLNLNGNYNITTLGINDDVDLKVLKISPSGSNHPQWSIPTLQTLFISDASLDSLNLSGLPNLTDVHLDNVRIDVITRDTLSGLRHLRSLDEQKLFRHATVIRSDTFKDLGLVTRLNLAGVGLEVIEPGGFNGLVGLERLRLEGNGLSEVRRCSFCGLSKVWYLDLSGNRISKVYPGGFEGLDRVVHMKLNDNELTELVGVSGLSNLAILDLSGNRLKGTCGFGGLSNLRVLDLSDNDISNVACEQFPGNLDHLNLQGNVLVQPNPTELLKVVPMVKYVNVNDHNNYSISTNSINVNHNNPIVIYW